MENNKEQKPVKIEFRKHADASGVYYYTAVNGISVTNSWDMNKGNAYQFFLRVVEFGGDDPTIEVIESVELNKSNNNN